MTSRIMAGPLFGREAFNVSAYGFETVKSRSFFCVARCGCMFTTQIPPPPPPTRPAVWLAGNDGGAYWECPMFSSWHSANHMSQPRWSRPEGSVHWSADMGHRRRCERILSGRGQHYGCNRHAAPGHRDSAVRCGRANGEQRTVRQGGGTRADGSGAAFICDWQGQILATPTP